MVFGCLLGNYKRQKNRNRFAIGRLKGKGNPCPHEHCCRRVALRHARVRYCDAMTQARRSQLLACSQTLQNLRIGKAVASRKQGRKPFE